MRVNGARNLPNYGEKKFSSLAGEVISRPKYSADLTDEQKVIAEYWKDEPNSELPPGHWSLFAEFVSRRDLHTIDQDAQLFFAQSNATLHAGIFSWARKRQFDSVRPVTLVHFLKGKKVLAWGGPFQGTKIIDGETWAPYQPVTIVTPLFPEYLSGHSIFSAAGAEVLKKFTGSDTFRESVTFAVGSSVVEPGLTPRNPVTLFWKTFSDAADQAGLSRRFGGIHFIPGDLDARKFGREIGRRAWAKSVCLFAGKRPRAGDRDDDEGDCETSGGRQQCGSLKARKEWQRTWLLTDRPRRTLETFKTYPRGDFEGFERFAGKHL